MPNKYSHYLLQLFEGVDIIKYVWQVCSDFNLITDGIKFCDTSFFGTEREFVPAHGSMPDYYIERGLKEIVTGSEFFSAISGDEYLVISLDMRAFPTRDEAIQALDADIYSYESYQNSSCQIVLLCVDTCSYDIYCKDIEIVNKIFANSQKIAGAEPRIITDENDTRKGLSA